MIPEQGTWLLCSVMPYNKLSLEEIGIELLISSFLENSGVATNVRFVPLCERPRSPPKHEEFLLKIQL